MKMKMKMKHSKMMMVMKSSLLLFSIFLMVAAAAGDAPTDADADAEAADALAAVADAPTDAAAAAEGGGDSSNSENEIDESEIVKKYNVAHLSEDYYNKSCPQLQQLVSDVIMEKQISSQTTAAGILRLYFHDCFVSGCDASVLVASNPFSHPERDAEINLSLPGDAFDLVTRAKTMLEMHCPGVVSCADILALAARELVVMLGGPLYKVYLGRLDSFTSTEESVSENLPLPNMTMTQIIDRFTKKGFSVRDLVALSGAHTVGFSHCKEYAYRIFDFNGDGHDAFDPTMNPRYARGLQEACANYLKDPTIATFNDVMTPGKFDNVYFQNLQRGLGLLESDQGLAKDPRTAPIVDEYAKDEKLFFKDFVAAMEKLEFFGVKTGKDGEVRRRCDVINEAPK